MSAVCCCSVGLAVCSLHYTGMQAASWHNSFDPPDLSGYVSQSTATAITLALSISTCATLLAVLYWRHRLYQSRESRKTSCLTLAVYSIDSKQRLLCTPANTLPSVVVDVDYVVSVGSDGSTAAHGGLSWHHPDFLRIFKVRQWGTARHNRAGMGGAETRELQR